MTPCRGVSPVGTSALRNGGLYNPVCCLGLLTAASIALLKPLPLIQIISLSAVLQPPQSLPTHSIYHERASRRVTWSGVGGAGMCRARQTGPRHPGRLQTTGIRLCSESVCQDNSLVLPLCRIWRHVRLSTWSRKLRFYFLGLHT